MNEVLIAGTKGPRLFLFAVCCFFTWGFAQGADVRLRGMVQDGSSRPIHEAVVEVQSREGVRLARGFSDHQGRFDFGGLPALPLIVVASKLGLDTVTATLSMEDADREIVLILVESVSSVTTDLSVFGAIPRTAASTSAFRSEEFSRRAMEEPGQILRVVPGLTTVQHAGGGKANQYLIRGFDADHGTDLALSFDGIPVNMVSHAHGQGYADLGFVIPEILQGIEVYKGPYFAEFGNLATAGAIALRLPEEFPKSFFKIQSGPWETGRAVLGLSPKIARGRGFVALEGSHTNGPFDHSQNFKRLNLISRWTFDLPGAQKLTLLGTGHEGSWDHSGQIPLREVTAGRLSRFGAIDPSEGGASSRYNFSAIHEKNWSSSALRSQFYAFHYDLDLFSNFTFFLEDPVHGDGIRQADRRTTAGGRMQYHHHHHLGGYSAVMTAGFDYRRDHADVGLFHQQARQTLDVITDSRIDESNAGFYLQQSLELHPAFSVVGGLRYDRIWFDVLDRGGFGPEGKASRGVLGPKVSFIYSPRQHNGPHFFANYGRGFHSNDARSAVLSPAKSALAAADGFELGYRQIFGKRIEVAASYWWLDLQSELIWVGDEGTTEFGEATRRHGPELEVKYKLTDFLFLDAGLFHSSGRVRPTGDPILRAPRLYFSSGFSFQTPRGLSGDLQFRHVGPHPLDEDGLVLAQRFTLADLFLRQRINDRLDLLLTIHNLFNNRALEAQTFFFSRLAWEPVPVGDNHFNPAHPLTVRGGIQWNF